MLVRIQMNPEDALRKIRLLRSVVPQNGATDAEAATAATLARALMERFQLRTEDVRASATSSSGLTWVYWETLLGEFGIGLSRFGMRGSAQWGDRFQVFIRLDTGHWSVKKQSSDGWIRIASDFGIESFRAYLRLSGPRSYSMA